VRVLGRISTKTRQIPTVHLRKKPLAVKTPCGGDYGRISGFMHFEPLKVASEIEAHQRVQFINQIRGKRHRYPFPKYDRSD
jgi:hypothetical protein